MRATALVLFIVLLTSSASAKAAGRVPYDRANPVIYDNDGHRDVYTLEYLMALASNG